MMIQSMNHLPLIRFLKTNPKPIKGTFMIAQIQPHKLTTIRVRFLQTTLNRMEAMVEEINSSKDEGSINISDALNTWAVEKLNEFDLSKRKE